MDDVTRVAAASTVFADPDDARRWYRLLAEQVPALGDDASVDEATGAIRECADAEGLAWAAEALLDYLAAESSDPLRVLRDLADPDLESEYVEASSAAAPETETAEAAAEGELIAPVAEFDEEAWRDYLARWDGQWDGAEDSWESFKDSFLYWAPEGVKAAAQQLVETAEASDKTEFLAPYGITSPETDAATSSEPAPAPVPTTPSADAEAAIAAVLADRPDLAALGTARLQELFASVMAEVEDSRSSVTN